MIKRIAIGICALTLLAAGLWAAPPPSPPAEAAVPEGEAPAEPSAPAPIRALYITGGGWHDYPAQQKIITEGLGERLNIVWQIDHAAGADSDVVIDRFTQPNWAEGLDVVVYNKCHSGVKDAAVVEAVADMHHETGVAAIFMHCAIHSFRAPTDKWFRLGGVTSHRHESHRPLHVEALEPTHPIMAGFPEEGWDTPDGELYEIVNIWDTATPLAHAYGEDTEKHHVTVWTNQHGKARVFGTTIGHHNETMADPVYLDLISRGLLWSVNRLSENGEPLAGAAKKKTSGT